MNSLLAKLSQFVGYGPENAKTIFIGIEEKTYDNDEISYKRRLEIQAELEPFTDLSELCGRLAVAKLYNPQKTKPQSTWAPLCSVMLGIDGKIDEMDKDWAVIKYQTEKLGRIPGDSLLAELLPVPKFSSASVGIIPSRVLGIPDDIDDYHQRVLPDRQKLLAKVLSERFQNIPPRLIVAYGRPWRNFETIFQDIRQMLKEDGQMSYNDDEHLVSIDGRLLPRFKWAIMKGCVFALTYHPAARDKFGPMRFDPSVAKRIVEIYKEQIGS
jgi:hypothetical protein